MKRLFPVSLVVVAVLSATDGSAQTQTAGVRDQAGMFSSEAVQKANQTLQDVERGGRLRVLVETVESLGGQSPRERAIAKVRTMDGRGLYILLSRNDHKVEIEPTRSAMTLFSADENKRLVKVIVDAFKEREFDRGLIAVVDEIQKHAVPTGGVKDAAGMFSSEAVDKANRTLKEIQQTSKWQVVIETIDSLNGRSEKEVALANARGMNLNGVYILIAKSDHKDYIEPSPSARAVFTPTRISELVAGMHRSFKASEFDRGLLDTVEQIRKHVQSAPASAAAVRSESTPANKAAGANVAALTHKPVTTPTSKTPLPPAPAASEKPVMLPPAPVAAAKASSNFLPILIIGGVGVLALIWLLSKALRGGAQPSGGSQGGWQNPQAASGPQQRGNPPPQGYGPQPGYGPPPPGYAGGGYGPPPPRQGGGFMSGLLGGAAGAVAGNILYDQFGRPHHAEGPPPHEHQSPYPPEHDAGSPPEASNIPDAGAGGDWGSADGGQANTADDWAGDAGASGDWGGSEPAQDDGAGGDWGSDPTPDYGADVDSGGGDGAGGDWGGDASGQDPDQGGSW